MPQPAPPVLALECPDLSPAEIQDLTGDLIRQLNEQPGLEAAQRVQTAAPGSRGDAITIGNIVLAVFTSGAAVAALEVLKTYFQRQPKLKMKLKTADGEELTLEGTHLDAKNTAHALRVLEKAAGRGKP